jgi:carbonic anhydrase
LVFDQDIGDVFSTRTAGNIIIKDILGAMEYTCKVAGYKIVVVMGHTKCGAVTATWYNVKLGNISFLLLKIKPAFEIVKAERGIMNDDDKEEVSKVNVRFSMDRIKKKSTILSGMERNNNIEKAGALYNVTSSKVKFFAP